MEVWPTHLGSHYYTATHIYCVSSSFYAEGSSSSAGNLLWPPLQFYPSLGSRGSWDCLLSMRIPYCLHICSPSSTHFRYLCIVHTVVFTCKSSLQKRLRTDQTKFEITSFIILVLAIHLNFLFYCRVSSFSFSLCCETNGSVGGNVFLK